MTTTKFAPSPIVKLALDHLSPSGPIRALDLGAGQGRNAKFLANQNFLVTAIDKSAEVIEQLNSISGISAIQADLASYEIPDNHDLIIMTNVLHFLPIDAVKRILEESARKINTGGVIVIAHILDNSKLTPNMIEAKLSGLTLIEHETKTVNDPPHLGVPYPHQHNIAYYIYQK